MAKTVVALVQNLVVRPEVVRAEPLRGKSIGISRYALRFIRERKPCPAIPHNLMGYIRGATA